MATPPLFAVADGMGGHAAGDRASALAVLRLAELGGEHAVEGDVEGEDGAQQRIRQALTAAASDIDAISDEIGVDAGTTATGVVLVTAEGGPKLAVFNVGDSRVYRFRSGRLSQITKDHSVVQELVDAGEIDSAAAEYHPAANVITRALGFHERPQPDFGSVPAQPGLRLLICSDGLSKEVDAEHLRLLLGAELSAEVTASALVDAALAAGGRDNVSVIVLDVLDPVPTLPTTP